MQHVAKNQSVVRYSVFGSAIKLLSLLAFVAVSYGAGVSASRADTSPSFICGVSTVRDVDGNIYHTTDVHGQCWMSENMRVGTMILGGTDQTSDGSIEKYCYNNDLTNCATDGGLYQWDEAMQYSTTEGAQGICPAGWHIPTDVEFYTLG